MEKLKKIVELTTAILQKKDEELLDELNGLHYDNPKELVSEMKTVQNGMEEIIAEYVHEVVVEYRKTNDTAYFMNEVRRRMREADDLFFLLFSFLQAEFPAFMRREVQRRLKKEVPYPDDELSTSLLTLLSVHEALNFARLTARTKADGITRRILEILEEADDAAFVMAITEDERLLRLSDCRRTAIESVETLYHIGQMEAWRQNPYIVGKTWAHEMNEKLHRAGHIKMDGVTVGVNETFKLPAVGGGIVECQYPRDPSLPPTETIRCHCQMKRVMRATRFMFPQYLQSQSVEAEDRKFRAWATDEELSVAEAWAKEWLN